ncbi:transcriptional regulator [Paenibacillus sp. J31TS4]|uniref:SpoIIE family protein phosphatase n=1 Tax=Paenibacillus sp. J31TS4 TaxID=2807195 RepID=UPI001B1AB226|nr:fused response regulator/phosphatase [Paenibacillus sp. J31TS4]GIP40046.1 transcriptional regulator [Paenibacillus sp. J31TS4]
MSILIVDDNPVNLIIIEKILKNEGYTDTVKANSAYELFDYLKIDSPDAADVSADLILLDMMMPEIDGLEVCRRIQQVERLRDIPIIIVTALGDSNKLAEALDMGASDYVMKPINKVELMARIRVALRLKEEKDWHIERDRKIRYELDLARQVQRSVLSQPVDNASISICANYYPSSELAGDMYSWYQIDEHRYGVILLDTMGHGISSSLVCMFISSALQDTITALVDPELVMQELNRYMSQLYNKEHFMHYYFTAIYLVIDTREKTIEYVNAGHPPAVAYLDDGEVQMLDKGCCAIGFFEKIEIQKETIRYRDSARLFLYTDGLAEAMVEEKDEIEGMGRLVEVLADFRDEMCTDVVERIVPEERRRNQQDDMCLVMLHTKREED